MSKPYPSLIIFSALLFISTDAVAKKTKGRKISTANSCGPKQAASTVYNLPSEKDPSTWKPSGFKSFRDSVKMQGSGRTSAGTIARYKGPDVRVPSTCKTTTTSSSGQCLMSYFSVAADPKHWRFGDIIYMRSLADKEITLPGGRKIRHPGFLIVQDTGGAIKGANRFDFFIGTTNATKSEFNKFNLTNKSQCKGKEFEKIDRGSDKYKDALAQIYKNQDSDDAKPRQQGDAPPAQKFAMKD